MPGSLPPERTLLEAFEVTVLLLVGAEYRDAARSIKCRISPC
jgi:hypothetical protein